MSELQSIKQALHQQCHQHIRERIESIEKALASIEESRNHETKSSVGDKYETGRAMMQQEEEKYRTQLANAQHIRNTLERINPNQLKKKVELGSLVVTDSGNYYIAIGVGKIKLEEGLYYAISIDAPISQALWLKQKGDILYFNQKQISILAVT